MIYKSNKYNKAQMYLLYYMLKNDFVIFMYNSEKVYMPNEKYRNLANNIVSFYESKNENLSFEEYYEKEEKILQTLKEIQELRMKDTCTVEEIKDYIRTIKEYCFKNNIAILSQKLKNEQDVKKKIEITEDIMKTKNELNKFLENLR